MSILKIDTENGCEECWNTASEILRQNGTGHSMATTAFKVDAALKKELKKAVGACKHNPPKFAPSIFVWD